MTILSTFRQAQQNPPEFEAVEPFTPSQLAARRLGRETVPLNPNVPISDLTTPFDREVIANIYNPEIYQNTLTELTKQYAKKYEEENTYDDPKEAAAAAAAAAQTDGERILEAGKYLIETKIGEYNRPPLPFDRAGSYPDYDAKMKAVENYDSSTSFKAKPITPAKPWGYERTQEIKRRGFNADFSNQIQFDADPVADNAKSALFNFLLAFNPRQRTKENYAFLGEKVGLDGEFIYINPDKPFKFGVGYKPTGQDDVQIVNSPQLSATDLWTILQEAPSIAGDVGATIAAAKKFIGPVGAGTGLLGGVLNKVAQTLGLSGAAALGATGGDLTRLLFGKYVLGAHDLDDMEIFKESGIIGAYAFGGTAAVSLSARAIAKIYKVITGKNVSTELWDTLDDTAQYMKGTKQADEIIYGDPVSVKEIQEQIDFLTDIFKDEAPFFKENFKPLLTSSATELGSDLEYLFLKNATNSKLQELYARIRSGNLNVIKDFVRVLREKIGPSTKQLTDATSADLSEGAKKIIQQEIAQWDKTAEDVIEKLVNQIGGADDAIAAGGGILGLAARPEISSKTFPRTSTELKKAVDQYRAVANENWNKALKNPAYEDITTGAGKTTIPTNDWMKANSRRATQIFKDPQASDALDDLLALAGPDAVAVLNRLRGRGTGGKFKNPEFTLDQLNSARVEVNRYASSLAPDKSTAFNLARDLERGLEQQIDVLIRNGASIKSMKDLGLSKPLNNKELTKWIEANKYGTDLPTTWQAQSAAYNLIETDLIKKLLNTNRPEAVADIIFSSSVKGTGENTVVQSLMTVLKDSPEQVFQLQEGLAAYIRREVFDVPNLNPFQKASNFQKFKKQHEGVLKEVFGERTKDGSLDLKNYNSRFLDKRSFQKNVLDPIEQANVDIKRLQARFGGLALGDSKTPILNIVENILREGARIPLKGSTEEMAKATARLLDDAQYLKRIADNNPIIKKQIAQVFKRNLLKDILEPRGAAFGIDAKKLNRLINEGFGPEEISGPRLTFESLVVPLLGKKDGKAFVKNMRHLNGVVQRVRGVNQTLSQGTREGIEKLEKTSLFFRLLQRIFLSPISKESRRTSVMINTATTRSKTFVGRMLADPELFERSMAWARGRENLQKFITMLSAHNSIEARDLGNELKYYDRINKKQTKSRQNTTTNPVDPVYSSNIPDRVLDFYREYGSAGLVLTASGIAAASNYFFSDDNDDEDLALDDNEETP